LDGPHEAGHDEVVTKSHLPIGAPLRRRIIVMNAAGQVGQTNFPKTKVDKVCIRRDVYNLFE
jgi:hypothetical protein